MSKIFKRFTAILDDPLAVILIGLIIITLAYLLYPTRSDDMVSGMLLGSGITVLIWIAYKVRGTST